MREDENAKLWELLKGQLEADHVADTIRDGHGTAHVPLKNEETEE